MIAFCYDAILTEKNQKNIYFDFNKFERSVANKLRTRTNTFLIKTTKLIGHKLFLKSNFKETNFKLTFYYSGPQ